MASNSENEPIVYTLENEDGVEQQFEIIDVLELDNQKYFALVPYIEDIRNVPDNAEELVILKIENVDGEEVLVTIDDDDEYDKVGSVFLKRIEEEFGDEFEESEEKFDDKQ